MIHKEREREKAKNMMQLMGKQWDF